MGEHWKPVEGYEGAYEVSDFGRVRKGDRIMKQRSHHMNGHIGQMSFYSLGENEAPDPLWVGGFLLSGAVRVVLKA